MANRASFRIDLEQTTGIVLDSLSAFQQSVQAFQGITEPDLTKKAILILQRYITSIKNFNNLSDVRREFFSSKQFVNTFTEQLLKLVSVNAPQTYSQFQQELKDESKSSTTQFLDTIFLKSYGPKGAGSWRGGLEKTLDSRGTLCTNVQPIVEVPVDNADNPRDDELQAYAVGLDPNIKAVARQNADPSKLINYSFSGGAPGFMLQAQCYLCGLPIAAVTPGGSGNTNCEHIMPILSALQKWDFIYRYEVKEPIRKIRDQLSTGITRIGFSQLPESQRLYIKRLFQISDEFAWSHWCCNMLKLDLDFLHLNNNGMYVPHYHNIKTFLTWLSDDVNRGIFDCGAVLQRFNLDDAKSSLMARVKRLCRVLNERNRIINNPNSSLDLIKVYGIFLLLQYVTVTDFQRLIALQGQMGPGGLSGGNPFGISKQPITPPTWVSVKKIGINSPVQGDITPPTYRKKVVPYDEKQLQKKKNELERQKKWYSAKMETAATMERAAAAATMERAAAEAEAAAAAAAAAATMERAAVINRQDAIQLLKAHFYEAIPRIHYIKEIKKRLSLGASNINDSTALLNNEDDFNTMVTTLLGQYTWTEMINSITRSSGVSTVISTENIESICLGWFRDMVYDYVNIKLMITIKRAKILELQTRAGTGDANAAAAAAGLLENDIRCLKAMSSGITTLQGMIGQAHSQIYLPLVQGLTTSMGTWSPIVDNIDNVDNVIFSLEQLVEIGARFVTEDDVGQHITVPIQELIQQIQAQAPLILSQLGLYIQNINQQIPQITNIKEALSYANIGNVSLDAIAANILELSAKITELQAHYNTLVSANIQHASAIPPSNQQEIQRVALYSVALVKLKELLLSRNLLTQLPQLLTQLSQLLTQLLGNIAGLPGNVELIKSTLIEPLVAFQTYMTSVFTDFVSSKVPAIVAIQGAAAAEGGGKLIRKRKTTRRNVVVIKRKKHNKSRKHKTRKHKTRKHKTRRHKMRRNKRSS